jgi:Mg-chelatase subunit ChlD
VHLLPLFLCSWTAAVGPGGPAVVEDPLARLRVWVERCRLSEREIDEERERELRALLGELRLLRAGGLVEERAIDRALVDLASLGLADAEAPGAAEDGAAVRRRELGELARLGRSELEGQLAHDPDREFSSWLASEVLAPEARRPRAERILAAELLAGRYRPGTRLALERSAREEDRELSRAALQALAGWPDASVHLFFLERLERDEGPLSPIAEHFALARDSLGTAVLERLSLDLARLYLSEDWREATRARTLLPALDTERSVPLLIEALATWERRAREGHGSRRVQEEIASELQRRSGRALGTRAQDWLTWWEAVRTGRIALPEEIRKAGGEVSSAAFFGLHAGTDRVLFVVDRSGSMASAFGTSGRTRYEEAQEQLFSFLRQSGEETRFSIALFSDQGSLWRSKLVPASAGNLEQAARWLRSREPQGGTLLFEGLEQGLRLDQRGRLPSEGSEIDTVIVLCDGATGDGPGWVQPWLERENERARIVFHCVQIGSEGNGTLEALARGSGGEFVQVRG